MSDLPFEKDAFHDRDINDIFKLHGKGLEGGGFAGADLAGSERYTLSIEKELKLIKEWNNLFGDKELFEGQAFIERLPNKLTNVRKREKIEVSPKKEL